MPGAKKFSREQKAPADWSGGRDGFAARFPQDSYFRRHSVCGDARFDSPPFPHLPFLWTSASFWLCWRALRGSVCPGVAVPAAPASGVRRQLCFVLVWGLISRECLLSLLKVSPTILQDKDRNGVRPGSGGRPLSGARACPAAPAAPHVVPAPAAPGSAGSGRRSASRSPGLGRRGDGNCGAPACEAGSRAVLGVRGLNVPASLSVFPFPSCVRQKGGCRRMQPLLGRRPRGAAVRDEGAVWWARRGAAVGGTGAPGAPADFCGQEFNEEEHDLLPRSGCEWARLWEERSRFWAHLASPSSIAANAGENCSVTRRQDQVTFWVFFGVSPN